MEKGAKLKETELNEFVSNGVKPKTEYECCLSCLELQDKITEPNEKIVHLELAIAEQNSVIEVLNQRNKELQEGIQNSNDEEEDGKCTVLMIENEALKCQNNKAERGIECWKAKCSELENVLIDLKKRLSSVNVITKTSSFSLAGTSPINTLYSQCTNAHISKKGRRRKLKNIFSSTPGGGGGSRPPFGPNEISDSDDNTPILIKRRKVIRGVSCVVSSESDDDNIPICRVISKKSFDECEGESLGGFIVSSSSDDSGDDESSENASESSAVRCMLMSYQEFEGRGKIKRGGNTLADLAKSPKLCMKAVCALYRQQTPEEQSSQATIVRNGRGFSHFHSFMGTELADYLTDGDTWGDVKKTEKEVREVNSYGIEHCTKMATHYSKQLFEIYRNNEDSFFRPEDDI